MATRKDDLTREAARLFAERGFHGTSMGDLADALGVQKGSLYSLTGSKQELLLATLTPDALTQGPQRAEARRLVEAWGGHAAIDSVGTASSPVAT